ncbi:MAG: hypothetical protein LBO07_03445 [Coriobacteriales bacterium]|jgi:uncharacterized protein YjiS (DUF1127 family)|nr:hypothetical protein [Coriobacteriales bacterium]
MSPEPEPFNESINGPFKDISAILDAADDAFKDGRGRLAIHLYCAAFEMEQQGSVMLSRRVIDGLRKAWDAACDLGDRPTAEELFDLLAPYNTSEQTEQGVLRLQGLAVSQLEDMGISPADLESVAEAISQMVSFGMDSFEAEDAFDISAVEDDFDISENFGASLEYDTSEDFGTSPDSDLPTTPNAPGAPGATATPGAPTTPNAPGAPGATTTPGAPTTPAPSATPAPGVPAPNDAAASQDTSIVPAPPAPPGALKAPGSAKSSKSSKSSKSLVPSASSGSRQRVREHRLDYDALAGYHDAIAQMRRFGFIPRTLEQVREFIERASKLHGVFGLSLSEPFYFHGPSRADVAFFAHATAGEIGWPVLHIDIEMEPDGSGTIKVAGPFKRGFLGGPPDIMELETPCTVLIENIDFLQQMFGTEERTGGVIESHGRGMHGRSLRGEMTGYLRTLLRKPGVFLIVTAATPEPLVEPLRSLVGVVQRIAIDRPTTSERCEVWQRFAADHPSFTHLDIAELAGFSEGLSRHEIVMSGHNAVEQAYRSSLASGEILNVSLGEVLVQLASFVDRESETYRRLEDEAVAQLYRDLEQGLT